MSALSQKAKIEMFDSVMAERDKLRLAVYDLVNGKFSALVRVPVKQFDASWTGGWYSMRLSNRAMPLYMVQYHLGGQSTGTDVWTDQEILDIESGGDRSTFGKCLLYGRNVLQAKYNAAGAA